MQSLVLDKFDYGIISNPDQEDISEKAASYSLNIDGDNEDGKLKGIPTTSEFTASSSAAIPYIKNGVLIQNSSTYDLIFHDSYNNKIRRLADAYNGSGGTLSDLVTTNISDSTCLIVNNKEAHIGTGSASTNVPLWCGIPGHQTFGGIGKVVFTGGGVRDLWVGGSYTGSADATFTITIENPATTYKWKKDSEAEDTGNSIVANQEDTLKEGIKIRFNDASHTAGDVWVITVYAQETFVSEKSYLTSCEYGNLGTGYIANGIANAAFAFDSNFEYAGVLAGSYFTAGYLFRYKFSVVYDGYQESPLSYDYLDHTAGVTDEYDYVFGLQLGFSDTYFTPDDFSKRITAIKIYRADSPTGNAGDLGLYKLVKTIDVNNTNSKAAYWDTADWLQYPGGDAFIAGDYDTIMGLYDSGWQEEKIVIIKDTGEVGASYAEETGMPQSLTNVALNYSLSAKGNGYHFISGGYHADISNATNYIFRSKELRFDQFDYVNDFLVMPRTVTALCFYEGKLYAFDANHIYRINPEGLYIEDAYEGVGALGQRSVLATAYGMFFCNDNGAYAYRNGQVEPISEAIKIASNSNGISWQSLLNSTIADTIVAFDSLRNQVLFMATSGSAVFTAWVYHVTKNRWDYWTPYSATTATITLSADSGSFTGKDGEIYISNATKTYKLLRGGSQMGWEWISKEFHFENPSQDKWLGAILVDPTTNVTVTYGTEGTAWTSLSAYTHGNNLDIYKKTLQIKVAGTTTAEVDSIEIIYRNLVGRRYYA